MRALPGIGAAVVDDNGDAGRNGGGGYLVLTEPWPSMLRGIWGDPQRYKDTYWSRWPQYYFAGDGAKLDEDGAIWLLGRVDDVMNVSGHRISTTEVESALVSHPAVAEAAVVGRDRRDHRPGHRRLRDPARRRRRRPGVGPGAAQARRHGDRPDRQTPPDHGRPELPKTRSGKIMRRLLRDVAENRSLGDVTTLADPTIMNLISEGLGKGGD
jgi:acetyl-CoA synthetase